MLWKCKDKTIDCASRVQVMGIVNITPDSFSDGGLHSKPEAAVEYALQLLHDGADILDLGAQSTRPGYVEISPEEEWKRLQPVLCTLRKKTDAPLSVDTYFPYVAQRAAAGGADIINDVSGSFNPEMAAIIKQYQLGWVMMHSGPGGAEEVRKFFLQAEDDAASAGISPLQLCFDMGIGFGKSYEENLELLAKVTAYKPEARPLLLGVSRKRVIGKGSEEPEPRNRVYGNIAADTAAILGGVNIIRLHDVKNEIKGIKMAEAIKQTAGSKNG